MSKKAVTLFEKCHWSRPAMTRPSSMSSDIFKQRSSQTAVQWPTESNKHHQHIVWHERKMRTSHSPVAEHLPECNKDITTITAIITVNTLNTFVLMVEIKHGLYIKDRKRSEGSSLTSNNPQKDTACKGNNEQHVRQQVVLHNI